MDTNSTNPTAEADVNTAEEAVETMADLAAYEDSFKTLSPGDFLTGHVVAVNDEGILVDVGYKSEGLVPANQVSHNRNDTPASVCKVGDEINVVVQRVNDGEGTLILSKKRADADASWQKIIKAYESGEIISAMCTEEVKGGLIVNVGMRGFVPASHVDRHHVRELQEFVGQELQLKVIEVDKSKRKVVLSRKNAMEEINSKKKSELMANLVPGQTVTGVVARTCKFGAFVNLGGVDGLVHISELSHKRINDPSEVVKPGQSVDVVVLKVEPEKDRISLSLKQATVDPWVVARDSYKEGDIVKGKVVRNFKNTFFIEVMDGVEGVYKDMSRRRGAESEEALKIGQEVEARITTFNPESHTMQFSLKLAKENNAEGGNGARMRHTESGASSIGDRLGADFMQKLNSLRSNEE